LVHDAQIASVTYTAGAIPLQFGRWQVSWQALKVAAGTGGAVQFSPAT